MMNAETIAKGLKKPKQDGDGWMACCPAHKDNNPSLSIKDGEKGLVAHCFAGCEWPEIRTALEGMRLLPVWEGSQAQERKLAFTPSYPNPRIHTYRDKDGSVPYYVHRQPNPDGGKTFRQLHLNGSGTYKAGMDGVTRIPYHLNLWHDEPAVMIVEGEQCADALVRQGYAATCNPGGASTWQPELNEHFRDKHVTIIPDNDKPGQKHALATAEALHGTAKTITIANICWTLPDKADIVDWMVKNSRQITELHTLVRGFPIWNPGDDITTNEQEFNRDWLTGSDIQYVMDANWTIRDLVVDNGFMAAYGKPGAGKTFWGVDVGLHIACGVGYANKMTKHGPVAYIALESGRRLQNRVMEWFKQHSIDPAQQKFHLSTDPLDLLTPGYDRGVIVPEAPVHKLIEDLQQLNRINKEPMKVVFIDTLSRAMAGGNENSPEDMTGFVGNCDLIWKTMKCTVIIIHHTGKDTAKGLRGHSSLLGAVDTEVEITTITNEYKEAVILKQRDGPEGERLPFKLEPVDIGMDTDGEMLTTCRVQHLSDDEVPAEARKPTRSKITGVHQKAIWKAMMSVTASTGMDRIPGPDYPTLRCVTKEQLRQASYLVMASDKKHQATDFKNGLAGLAANDHVGIFGDYVWIVGE